MGIAGQPSGDAPDVAEVFSTFLYDGNAGTNTINNGIDLSGEGGMVWIKRRDAGSRNHFLADTENGPNKSLTPNTSSQAGNNGVGEFVFNSNGFTLGGDTDNNSNTQTFASWSFRKREKFFDIVTYSGNNTANRAIAHSLNNPVGMLVVKSTNNNSTQWYVWHNSYANNELLVLNENHGLSDIGTDSLWANTTPTNTHFYVTNNSATNGNGSTYVAYLFADNSSEDAADQMIKCGSFATGSASSVINLGWEPQFFITKKTSASGSWALRDSMRGSIIDNSGDSKSTAISADNTDGESSLQYEAGVHNQGIQQEFADSSTYLYVAIRAPMMKEPEAATDVFKPTLGQAGNNISVGFPMDMAIIATTSGDAGHDVVTRLQGEKTHLRTSSANQQTSDNGHWNMDSMDTFYQGQIGGTKINYFWKRAKGYMDVVAYTNNSYAGITVNHNLGVIPEMMWLKQRNSNGTEWSVYHSSLPNTSVPRLNQNAAPEINQTRWNSTNPTDTVFSTTESGGNYIVYLFATLAGISKVGSYTGNGSNQTIDCGFSAGARFILIKRTDATGHWYVWDSVRGIVAGNDPRLLLNNTEAQETTDDSVDPHNSGFIVNQLSVTALNVSSGTYLFYAIA